MPYLLNIFFVLKWGRKTKTQKRIFNQSSSNCRFFRSFYEFYHCQVLFAERIGNRFLYFFSSRLYTEIFGIASVSSWYGVWTLFDYFIGYGFQPTVLFFLLSYAGLFCTKTVRNITASPFAIITDKKNGYFDVSTLFQWSHNVSIMYCLIVYM